MGRLIEELDYRETAMGPLILRRRWVAAIDADVVEVILGDEHLMSSLFTVGETELATRGLAAAKDRPLRVLVGGLGLGYTARAALADPRVTSVEVVDALAPVIEWHEAGLVPLGESLGQEPRCHLKHGDFFGWFDAPRAPEDRYDVVLLDIDHSPRALLHPDHARFYADAGLRRLRDGIADGGVFAMWSDEGPDAEFIALLEAVFVNVRAEVVAFDNPLTGGASTCTIYVCDRD
ncbi:MAG: spermidine synthase [Alphaproteobacteria bacterium]|nr:spermidine synthase [Alphaproteobacteria bacterium]MBU4041112.1 spermidine synthase [Alphaproteobacteria bacterium]MBU4137985.1 spermidine synthase [Alphaproteobacteria bacterium]